MKMVVKRHHYIPQFLLRNFTDEYGKLWVFSKRSQEVRYNTPKNIDLEKHYNSTYENSQRNNSLELKLSKLESRLAPTLKDTLNRIRDRRSLDLSSKKIEFQKLIYLQFCRSRSIKDGFWDQRKDMRIHEHELQNKYVDMIDINVNAIHNEVLPLFRWVYRF